MKVEIITYDADPDHGGFGTRVHSLVRMFSQFALVRVVLTDWFGGPRVRGVTYDEVPLKETLRSRLQRLRSYYRTTFPSREVRDAPDITVVESLDLLGLHQYGDEVPLVLDEHNVYWDLLRYEMVNSPFFETWLGRRPMVRRWLVPRLLMRAKSFEVGAIQRASRTLVTSDDDRSTLLEELPELEDRIHVLPNCIDLERFPRVKDIPEGKDVVFIGNYNYLPNREAALFISNVLSRELPGTRFLLVGSNPPAEAAESVNVSAPGHVQDLQSVLEKAAVCISPLAQGSGTRLKILTYLAAGKAVVTTTKACEGLAVRDGIHVLVRDDPEEFRLAVSQLLKDPELRERLGAQGRKLVETKYDWRVHVNWLRDFAREIPTTGRGTV